MSSKLAIARAYLAARRERKLRLPIPDYAITGEDAYAANFACFNTLGLSLDEARKLAREELETGRSPYPGYSFGLSSGTAGEPGVFITTQAERDRWLGTVLGKFLSPSQLFTLNAALLLKHNNALYNSSRVTFYDVANLLPAAICKQKPNVLIGPPSALVRLANSPAFRQEPFQPHMLICAAEALFPQDREKLTQAFQTKPRNLYQAKEGFLAAGCTHGHLHWNEDLMRVEFLHFKSRPDRAIPVITDYTRQSQTFTRYRIDDVIVLGEKCPCKTPFQKIATVEGRLQDLLLRPQGDTYEPLFPLDLNELLLGAGEYTIRQHSPEYVSFECTPSPSHSVQKELRQILGNPARFEVVPYRPPAPTKKRRRFQRLFKNSVKDQFNPTLI
ncbi:MAG: hypothetical protein HYX27_02455 [Acidobacteria bacterium]|nr:hypothetical protein [Acidobacteriota bacterium]